MTPIWQQLAVEVPYYPAILPGDVTRLAARRLLHKSRTGPAMGMTSGTQIRWAWHNP
jgi:hypothetical protein